MDYTLDNVLNKWLLINFVGYFCIILSIIYAIFYIWENYKIQDSKKIVNKICTNNKFLFCIIFICIFLAWIPYFLKFYPGIITSDSCSQIEQIMGRENISDHHPIMHTAIIGIFVKLGLIFDDNINTGIAVYSIAQMIIMALLDTSVILHLKKIKVPYILVLITVLYYMFYPINAIYSITMWKDILFAGVIPIFIILLSGMILETDTFFKNKWKIVLYIIFNILVIYLRHNGLYMIILSMPFVFIVLRKHWKEVLPLFAIIIVIYQAVNFMIYNVLQVSKGSIVEMLSVPVQQIARVEKYHRNQLDDKTTEQIKEFFLLENIGDVYDPILSDNVKWSMNETYFKQNKSKFIKLWLKLLVKYPKDYIESFISNSYGYYYPEARNNPVFTVTMDKYNIGIEQTPKIEGKTIEYIIKLVQEREMPMVSMIFSIGLGVWGILICLTYKVYVKEYIYILLYLPIFILWLTLVASPAYCEFRYAYPIFAVLPLYIVQNFRIRKE